MRASMGNDFEQVAMLVISRGDGMLLLDASSLGVGVRERVSTKGLYSIQRTAPPTAIPRTQYPALPMSNRFLLYGCHPAMSGSILDARTVRLSMLWSCLSILC